MDARYRLRRREDFARLREHGRVYRHALLHLSVVQNELEHNRYGFITSKRLGKAVQRNRVRRLLREAVRLFHPDLRSGFDILLIARPPLIGQPLATIMRTLEQLYRQAGLLRDDDG